MYTPKIYIYIHKKLFLSYVNIHGAYMIRMYTYIYIHIYIYMYIKCVYVYIYITIYTYVHMYICIHANIYIYMRLVDTVKQLSVWISAAKFLDK